MAAAVLLSLGPLAAGLLTVGAASASAIAIAATQAQPPVFRARVDLVELDLRVADAHGAAVTDLAIADLEILEAGRPQRIADLVHVSLPLPAPNTGPALVEPTDVATNYGASDARVYVLLLDDLHVDGRRSRAAQKAAHTFIDRVMAGSDLVAVAFASGRTDVVQGFTSNRTLVHDAIRRFTGRKLRSATLERLEVYNQVFRGSRGRPQPQDLRDTADQERAANATAALAALTSISSRLATIEGRRKALVLVSEGIDYDVSGLTNSPGTPSHVSMTPGALMTGLGGPDIARALREAVATASRANVTFYTIDPRSGDVSDEVSELRAPPEDPSLRVTPQAIVQEKQDAQQTLTGLAAQTGGFAVLHAGDTAAFDRIARDSSDYYLVRYSPDVPLERGEFREVEVKVRRPGVRVSARRGYFARPGPAATMAVFAAPGLSNELGAALAGPLPSGGLSLRVHAAPFRGDRKTAEVVVTVQVPGILLAGNETDDLTTTLEVGALAVETSTGRQAGIGTVIDVRLEAAGLAQLRRSDYRVVTRVALAPGRYELRAGLRDRRTRRFGTATLALVVPDFSDSGPTLSGLVLGSTISNAMPTAVDTETQRVALVMPTAFRRFTTSDELGAAIAVYGRQRGKGPLEVRTILEDERGTAVVDARTPLVFDASATPPVAGPASHESRGSHVQRIPLGDLRPGRYVVAVELWRQGARTPIGRRETRIVVS